MLVCVLIVATFRECPVCLVLLGLMVRMACLVNYLVPNRIVGVLLAWESGVGISAACSPWTSPEVVVSVRAWCSSLCWWAQVLEDQSSECWWALGAAWSQLSLWWVVSVTTETLNTGCSYWSLSKSMSLFSFFFTKYIVSFSGREGATGPKGSPGSPGTPGFPGAQVRLVFQINRFHKNYFRGISWLVLHAVSYWGSQQVFSCSNECVSMGGKAENVMYGSHSFTWAWFLSAAC